MKKRNALLIVAVSVIYLSFILGIGIAVYNYYYKEFLLDLRHSSLQNNLRDSEQFSQQLNKDYELFVEYIDNNTNNELNSNKPFIYNQKYLGFGDVQNDGYLFEGNIKRNFLLTFDRNYINQNISIYSFNDIFQNETAKEVYIFFSYNNRFGYFEATPYVSSILISENYMLANNKGQIFYNGVENNTANNLNAYLKDSGKIVGKLRTNEPGTRIDDSDDGRLLSSYSKVEAIDDLYLINYLDYKGFLDRAYNLINPVVAIIITVSMILVILSLFYGSVFTSIYRDVELSYHQLSYNNIPIFKINKKGRIVFKNKQFKKDFREFANNKYINEIFLIDILDIYKQVPLKAWLIISTGPYNAAWLAAIKTSVFSYTILVYPILGSEQQDGTALINIHTDIPSLNQYKLDYQELTKSFSATAKKQAIVMIRIINLRNAELMRGQAYVDEAVFKAAHRLRTLSAKIDGVKFYHSFDNSFVLLYESVDSTEVKEDVRRIIKSFEEEKLDQEYDIKFYLKAGLYEFNARTERSGALFVYEKAKVACESLTKSVDSVLGIYDSATDFKLQQNYLVAHDLEIAIIKRELYMAVQPIYDLEKEKVSGFEALLRWRNDKYKRVSPQTVIEVANESNLLPTLGNYIIEESLKIAKDLEKYRVTLAINLDPLQILQVGFVEMIKDQLKKNDVNPKNIIFELTENNIITFFDDIIEKIKVLQGLGIKFHIDDFGTGNSSLLYLKQLPIDGLKIDREFVRGVEGDRYLKAIVTMVSGLAKNLDVDVVAEGVETLSQLQFLEKRGVRFIQGYYIGRPLPIDETIAKMDSLNKLSLKGEWALWY